MDFKNLTTADKLLWIRTTAGLQQLEEWLKEGKSQRQIALTLKICAETLYRWRDKYPDIGDTIAPYTPTKAVPSFDMTRPPAYRIICAYEDNQTSILGSIYDEYDTLDELWNSPFMKEYFDFWKIEASDYYGECLVSLSHRGTYKLSNYIGISYCKVTAKGKIIALVPPTA